MKNYFLPREVTYQECVLYLISWHVQRKEEKYKRHIRVDKIDHYFFEDEY